MTEPVVEFKNVSLLFGGAPLVRNLNFRLERGGYLVVSGPTRSGKTSVVRLLTGLAVPDSGEITVCGEHPYYLLLSPRKLRRLRKLIGGVGGIYTLLHDRTVLDNVALSAEVAGISPRAARRAALAVCGRYRLSHVAGHYPGSISEAERRAALLARCEAGGKNLIVCDSPADGLDSTAANFLHERLAALHLSGASILYLTAGTGPVSGPTDRCSLIGKGSK